MSTLIEQIANYLEDQAVGTVATDIFITRLPEEPDNCIAIIGTGGVEPDKENSIRQKSAQVLVRNLDYEDGWDKSEEVFALLHRNLDTFSLGTGSVDVMSVMALQEVTPLGQDDNNRYLFTCNYIIRYRE